MQTRGVKDGFWHRARARQNSLSLSIGVLTPAARGGTPVAERAWHAKPGTKPTLL